MSIGEALARARREAGLSVSQVSERTRIREAIIRDIERDDYSACGGDFYARGHIRAIARAAGADSEPLIRQYDAARRPAEEPGPAAEPGPGESGPGESGPGESGPGWFEPAGFEPTGFGPGRFGSDGFAPGRFGSDGFAAHDFGPDELDAGDYPPGDDARGRYPRGRYPRGDYLADDPAAPDGFGPGEPEAPEEITSPHPVITTSQIAALEDIFASHPAPAPEAGTAQPPATPATPGRPGQPDPPAAPPALRPHDPAAHRRDPAAAPYRPDPAGTAPHRWAPPATAPYTQDPPATAPDGQHPAAALYDPDPAETAPHRWDPPATAPYGQDPLATAPRAQDPAASAPHRHDPAAPAPYRQRPPATASHRRDPVAPSAPYPPGHPEPTAGTSRRRPDWLGILASVLMLAVIGGGIYVLIPGTRTPSHPRPAAAGSARHGQARHGRARHQGGQPAARQSSPAGSSGSAPGATSPGTQTVTLTPARAVAFGPGGPAHGDNPQDASLAIDARPTTFWQSDWYATSHFGNLQSGTGLLLDMGHPVTITSVEVTLGTVPGAGLQVRVGDVAALGALHPAASAADAHGIERVRLASPANGRYVLIWFTSLPRDSAGTYRASVYNIRVRGTAT